MTTAALALESESPVSEQESAGESLTDIMLASIRRRIATRKAGHGE